MDDLWYFWMITHCNLEEKRNNSSTKWLGPTEIHEIMCWERTGRDGLERETAHTLKKMIYKLQIIIYSSPWWICTMLLQWYGLLYHWSNHWWLQRSHYKQAVCTCNCSAPRKHGGQHLAAKPQRQNQLPLNNAIIPHVLIILYLPFLESWPYPKRLNCAF